jgi:hypothetical protein
MKKLLSRIFKRETPGEPLTPPRVRTVSEFSTNLYEVKGYISPTQPIQ